MSPRPIIGLVLIVLIIGGLFFLLEGRSSSTLTTELSSPTSTQSLTTYTLSEVMTHNSANDCWMIIDGKIFDATEYIASKEHNPEILRGCGLDATEMFKEERKHRQGRAQNLLPELIIGTLRT